MSDRDFRSTMREVAKLVFFVLIVFIIVVTVTGKGKLYKSHDRILTGVAGGIADYLNVDPTMVRVIWGVSGLYYGVGAGAYILAWLIIPPRPF